MYREGNSDAKIKAQEGMEVEIGRREQNNGFSLLFLVKVTLPFVASSAVLFASPLSSLSRGAACC